MTGIAMRVEIVSAADFLVHLLRIHANKLPEKQLELFKNSIMDVLRRRYRDHWFPDRPNRGSGYRCLRINGKMDPVIAQAGVNVGLLPPLLHRLFPTELTMWIDPAEVSYRIGENGSICVLYEGRPEDKDDNGDAGSAGNVAITATKQQIQPARPQFESCKDSLILEHHSQFGEQIATFVSS